MLDLILVIIERKSPSVPSRTRQGNSVSPMVLWLKPRKSRSSPELSPVDPSVCYTAAADIKTEIQIPPNRWDFLFCFVIDKINFYGTLVITTTKKEVINGKTNRDQTCFW